MNEIKKDYIKVVGSDLFLDITHGILKPIIIKEN
jgi:hypothetical protein